MEQDKDTQAADVTANETDAAEATAADAEVEAEIVLSDDLAQLAQLVKELGGVDAVAAALRSVTANASRTRSVIGKFVTVA